MEKKILQILANNEEYFDKFQGIMVNNKSDSEKAKAILSLFKKEMLKIIGEDELMPEDWDFGLEIQGANMLRKELRAKLEEK